MRMFMTKSQTTIRLGRAAFLRANDLDYRRGIGDAVENFCNVAATADAQEGGSRRTVRTTSVTFSPIRSMTRSIASGHPTSPRSTILHW